jgi:hypothetical protein
MGLSKKVYFDVIPVFTGMTKKGLILTFLDSPKFIIKN